MTSCEMRGEHHRGMKNTYKTKKKLKVLVDLHHLYIAQTGIKSYLQNLVSIIESNQDKNHEYYFHPPISKVLKGENFRRKKWLFFRVVSQLEGLIWKQLLIPLKCKTIRPDIAFFPDYYAPIIDLNCRKVVMFHDTFFWDSPEHYGRLWLKYFSWVVFKGLKKNASIFTITAFSKRRIEDILKSPVRIDYLHHPYYPNRIQNTECDKVLERLDLRKDDFFLHVGVFEKRKELPLLVRAFNDFISNNDCETKLLLVGKEAPNSRFDDFGLIKALIQELKLENRVLIPGFLDHNQVDTLFRNALSYVCPSNNEGFGLPLIEAFQRGCPVITSNQEALVEVAGGAAEIFQIGSEASLRISMEKVFLSQEYRETLVSKGRERIGNFDPEIYLKKFEDYLSELVNISEDD